MSSPSCKIKGKDNDSHPPCSPERSNHNQEDECSKLNDATAIAMLFSDCDRTSCGHVRVSSLNDYMSRKIGNDPTWQAHNREMLQKMVQLLDPNQLDVEVTREQFISALKTILKIPDTDESQEYPIVEPDVYDVHILDTSTGVLDRSSYSCGGADTLGLTFNEEDDSEEKIQELHLKVRNLEITVANLTTQVELGEEYNTALHVDNDRLLAALHSAQKKEGRVKELEAEKIKMKELLNQKDVELTLLTTDLLELKNSFRTLQHDMYKLEAERTILLSDLELGRVAVREHEATISLLKEQSKLSVRKLHDKTVEAERHLARVEELLDAEQDLNNTILHLKEQNEDLSKRLTAQHNSFLSSLSHSSGGEQQQSLECPLWYSVIDKEDIATSPQLVSVLQEEARSRHQPEGAMQRQLSLKEELIALSPEVVMISREIQCEMLQATNVQQKEMCIPADSIHMEDDDPTLLNQDLPCYPLEHRDKESVSSLFRSGVSITTQTELAESTGSFKPALITSVATQTTLLVPSRPGNMPPHLSQPKKRNKFRESVLKRTLSCNVSIQTDKEIVSAAASCAAIVQAEQSRPEEGCGITGTIPVDLLRPVSCRHARIVVQDSYSNTECVILSHASCQTLVPLNYLAGKCGGDVRATASQTNEDYTLLPGKHLCRKRVRTSPFKEEPLGVMYLNLQSNHLWRHKLQRLGLMTYPGQHTYLDEWFQDTVMLEGIFRRQRAWGATPMMVGSSSNSSTGQGGMEHDFVEILSPPRRKSGVPSPPQSLPGQEQEEPSTPEGRETRSGSEGGESSVSSHVTEGVFPSLPDGALLHLGLLPVNERSISEVLTEQDVENRYLSLSLAFKTDKVTLSQRHELQHRQRDQAEKNMAAEVLRLKAAVHNLNRLCVDSESVEVLTQIQSQVDILQQSTNRVSTSAEMFGAVQQEHRLNKAVEVMLAHVDNLKRMHEKEHSELEETRRLLLENNIVVEDVADSTTEELTPRGRYRSLQAMVGNSRLGSKRRASIAALPRSIGSTDSIKSISSSGSFTDPKSRIGTTVRRRTSVAPMLSTSQSEGLPIRWDSSDRLDKQDFSAMDEIKELSESRRESGASERRYSDIEVTPPSSLTEENNNKQQQQQQQQQLVLLRPGPDGEVVARPILEVLPELMLLAGSEGDLSQDVSESEDADKALPVVEEEDPGCLRAHINFILDRMLQLMDPFLPLDTEYLVRSARYGLAVFLLLAALWCVGSSFFSSSTASASYQGCRPYSWRTYLQHKLNLYIKVKHLNEPPT